MTITKRLTLTFGLSLIITMAVGVLGYRGLSSNVATTDALVHRYAGFLTDVQTLKIEALQHRRYEKDFFLNIGKPEKQAKYIKKFETVSTALTERLTRLATVAQDEAHIGSEVAAIVASARAAYQNYHQGFMGLTRTVLADAAITPQQGNKLMAPFKDQIYTFEKDVDRLLEAAIVAMEAGAQEAATAGSRLKGTMLILALVGTALMLALAFATIRRIRSGLQMLSAQMQDVARGEGDLTKRMAITSKDEISEAAGWFNTFLEKLHTIMAEISGGVDTLSASSTELSAVSGQLASGAEETSQRSSQLAAAAEEMSANMNGVAAASEQASTNVQMVAAASEQMSATLGEITGNTEKGRQITGDAVAQAKNVSTRVAELGQAASEVGQVTETINEISEQTNLLALNATIEAARAGEAGKGFAVVANEIKELARQTAAATQDIRLKIEGMQRSTDGTVTEINQIETVITDIDTIVSTIASAVQEQSTSTREIADNVNQAADGIQNVNENVSQSSAVSASIAGDIAEVNTAAGEMADSGAQVNSSADELSKLSENLKRIVEQFKL